MHVTTPAVHALRNHLLNLSTHSIAPGGGLNRPRLESPEEEDILRRFRPFAKLLFLVSAIDGNMHKSERNVILGAFRLLTDGRIAGARLAELETEIRGEIGKSDVEELLEEVTSHLSLVKRDAELGFTLAAAVVLADEAVAAQEDAFLEKLAQWLAISSKRAAALLSPEE